ncbi:integral membrane protein [Aspergillus ellipticus CBS 707.79]|uniref:Integral membrane protein n=1 Tax=Aspergillus ellipticus CBS 707.79 TaxID=1448320 RepID=A0A319DJZ9_9EURO|nr:integral membrane protein [Aspergillus ellipticus CBS 707.79]
MGLSSRGTEMICIVSVLVGLSLLAVILRVVARLQRRVSFGVDDYLCFVCIILLIGMLIELELWVTIGGNGYHQSTLSNETMMTFYKIFLSNQFTYFIVCPTVKVSIICFYRRVFTIRSFQLTSFGINALIILWGVGVFLACALQCRPLKAYWDTSVDGQCLDGYKLIVANQIFNIVMDFVILALPVPLIWGLHKAWQDKLALNGVFALGGFVCFASIYRIVVLFWINPDDTTYTVYQATLWTHIEPCVGLICSCLPTIRGLFPRLKLSSQNRYRTAPYWINTEVSTSNCVATGPRDTDEELLKMEDGVVSRFTSTKDMGSSLKSNYSSPLDITVRTDINIRDGGLVGYAR